MNQTRDVYIWSEVPEQSLEAWSSKLAVKSCPYRQLPFWAKAYKAQGYTPRFFYCGTPEHPLAFVAVIEVGIFPFRFGLIDRGPFFFEPENDLISACLSSLIVLMKKRGYVFVRFTQGQESAFARINDLESALSVEPYPFCRDSRNSLIVTQKEDDNEMMASFSESARRKIRKGLSVGYDIRISDSDADFDNAWNLFEKLAQKKGFQLSAKPKAAWRKILQHGTTNDLATLYLCSYEEKLIAAQIIIRDGETAEGTLSALDVESLEGKPSPAALLTWMAMRDSHKLGCKYYNLGGPGDPKKNNYVFEFKRLFKPVAQVAPEPLCLTLRPRSYWIWNRIYLRAWRMWKTRFRSIGRKTYKRAQPAPKPPTDSTKTSLDTASSQNVEVQG